MYLLNRIIKNILKGGEDPSRHQMILSAMKEKLGMKPMLITSVVWDIITWPQACQP